MRLRWRAGDTLVEVLMATVVLSVVLAAGYTLSNRANRIGQAALERTEVSNQMQEYGEIIRIMRSIDGSHWDDIQDKVRVGSGTPIINNDDGDLTCNNPAEDAFVIDVAGVLAGDESGAVEAFSRDFASEGFEGGGVDAFDDFFAVWAEAYKQSTDSEVIDVHIKACWEGIGDQPLQYDSIIMRFDNA